MNVGHIQSKLSSFAKKRDWEKYHTPKNLVMALSVEVSELLEIFQWKNMEESKFENLDKETLTHVSEEIADILIYTLRLCDIMNISPEAAINEKIQKNSLKYPEEVINDINS